MIDQDTSAYWRKLLELDKALPPQLLRKYQSSHRFFRPLFYAIVSFFLRYYCPEKIYGIENLPSEPPYIIAANHGSSMDYVVIAWAMGSRKEELYPLTTKLYYDIPWTRFWIKVAANAVRIDTVEDFFPAMRLAAQILRVGKAVYINPEGLRSLNGKLLPFRTGVGVLAVETGVPLVPVYLGDTWKTLPTGWILPRPHPVSVTFGKPMEMGPYVEKKKNTPAFEVYKEVTEELRRRIIDLQAERSK